MRCGAAYTCAGYDCFVRRRRAGLVVEVGVEDEEGGNEVDDWVAVVVSCRIWSIGRMGGEQRVSVGCMIDEGEGDDSESRSIVRRTVKR